MMVKEGKKYTYFVGIDVSKHELDFAVMQGASLLWHREIENNDEDIVRLISELKSLSRFTVSRCLFCLENTGYYGNHLLKALKRIKANVVVENPLQINKSLGIARGKTDKLDAIRICQYAYRFKDVVRMWVPKRPIIELLNTLQNLRIRLIEMRMAVTVPLGEQAQFLRKGVHRQAKMLCMKTTKAIVHDLQEIDQFIQSTVNSDDAVERLVELITSVPGVGLVTAVYIVTTTNEFRDIYDPKKFACYAGVAPFKDESGKALKKKARISHIANKKMKSLLHTCAMAAISHKGELRDYYKRKVEIEGKPKMAVVNAVRYKLILRVFTCVSQNRPYQTDYQRTVAFDNPVIA